MSVYCSYFANQQCRSCSWIEEPYAMQLRRKQTQAQTALASLPNANQLQWLPGVASSPQQFRNKAKMMVGGSAQAPVLGLVDPRTDQATDLGACLLYPAAMTDAFPAITRYLQRAVVPPYQISTRQGEIKYVLLSYHQSKGAEMLMLRLVLRSREAEGRLRKNLASLQTELPSLAVVSINVQPVHQAIIEGEQEILLSQADHVAQGFAPVELYLQPQSFFQTNTQIAQALYQQAQTWIASAQPKSCWDLYCGVGGFALHAAPFCQRVLGIEQSASAIASAKRSAAGLDHVQFFAQDASAFAMAQTRAAQLVIVNPPRRGLGKQLCAWLEQSDAEYLLYSSCNLVTLQQDLAQLPSWQLQQAQMLDMFPHTPHFETMVWATR